ncbi:MAG: B12-binding domain-containing radical SAM protein [Candidatus Marinimicrobia bacterium]|nr:B12-binding domain-containing radical SAM protein [Candidatus Neomarinimicrobiota bacterium]
MKNVYFIQPQIEDFYTTPIRNIPLGLIQIATTVKNCYNVKILDFRNNKKKKINPPEIFKPLLQFYHENTSPFSLYKNYYRFGLSKDEMMTNIPDDGEIFCISSMFTTYSKTTFELIECIRKKVQNAKVIVGGIDASIRPDVYLKNGADFVIIGEGELSLGNLLGYIENKRAPIESIPNLAYIKNGKTTINRTSLIEDLDSVPHPDYNIDYVSDFTLNGKKHAMIMSSRGCPYKCKFCSIYKVMGDRTRTRSVENVIDEIDEKVKNGFTSFDFEDDNFGQNKKWLNNLLDCIIKYYPNKNLSLYAMNGITASNLDKNTVHKMKKAGFEYLNLSLVHTNENFQQALMRPVTTGYFSEILRFCEKINLPVIAYIILGMPGDTIDDMLKSILFLSGKKCLIGPSIFYLTPESDLYNKIIKDRFEIDCVEILRSTYIAYECNEFKRKNIATLFIITRIINFIKKIIDESLKPCEFNIENGKVYIKEELPGKEIKITLGFAILDILFKTGKLFYTGRKEKGKFYPLIEENVNQNIIENFLNADWNICGFLSGKIMSKKQVINMFKS